VEDALVEGACVELITFLEEVESLIVSDVVIYLKWVYSNEVGASRDWSKTGESVEGTERHRVFIWTLELGVKGLSSTQQSPRIFYSMALDPRKFFVGGQYLPLYIQ
jgi:hypothetical protein